MPFVSATIAAFSTFFASVGTFVTAVSATKIGAFLINTLSYVATNLLVQAIIGTPKPPPFTLRTTLRAGEETPRSFIFGQTMTAGSLVYANTYGSNNEWLTYVVALSDLPVKSLDAIWVNSELKTLGASDPDRGRAVSGYDGKLYCKFYDGTQTAADAFLVSQLSGDTYRPYGADRIGYGMAYVILHAKIDRALFSGFPQFRFLVDGVKLYDPSKDTSVGGSGTQRWDTPSTWGGDGDYLPAVQAYNVMRGITYGGAWLYGLQGVSEFRLPAADWITEIEKCRATVVEDDGSNPTFRCSVEVEVGQEIGNSLEGILTACAGRISETGGVFKAQVGPVGSSVKSFTDDDIIATADQTFNPFPALANTVNGITCQYPEPEEAYSLKTAPPLYDPDYETQDGGYRLLSQVTMPNVPYREQVQRLMKWALAEARNQRRHTLVMPPEWCVIEPNDSVTWSSGRNGYSNKLFRVEGVIALGDGNVIMELVETDPADYSWNTATDFTQVNVSPVANVRPPAISVIGFGVQPVSLQDASTSAKRVGLKLTWSTVGVDNVDGIRFEVRNQSTGEVVSRPETFAFDSGELVTETGLLANVAYEVRAIYISVNGRTVTWTSWVSATTSLTIAQPGVPTLTEELYPTRDGSSVKVLIRANWAASSEAVDYQVEARLAIDKDGNSTGDSFTTRDRTDLTESEIRDVASGTWEVRVKGFNAAGVQSLYSTGVIEVYGLSTPPAALTGIRIQKAGGIAILKWDKPTDLDVLIGGSIVIRHSASASPSWSNSVSMDVVDGNNSYAAVALRPGTYLMRAVDLTGVKGPVSQIETKGIQAVDFTNVQTFTAEPGWSGTKTDTLVDGSALKLASDGEPLLDVENGLPLEFVGGEVFRLVATGGGVPVSEGTYEFASGFDNLTVGAFRVRPVIDVAAVNLSSTIDDRLQPIDLWESFDDSDDAEIDVIVEMRQTDDDPSGSPVWSDWAQIDSSEEEFRAAEFRARLITTSTDYNVLLSGLSIEIDEVV